MKTYQVGGSVRDELLGVEPHDKDWVVVGSSPEEMIEAGFLDLNQLVRIFLSFFIQIQKKNTHLQELKENLARVIMDLSFTMIPQ